MSSTANLERHCIHGLSPIAEPDADFGSPNFPYARQDKKDKVRRDTDDCLGERGVYTLCHADPGLVSSSHQRKVGCEHAADGGCQPYVPIYPCSWPLY